jgi:hypothetical protein
MTDMTASVKSFGSTVSAGKRLRSFGSVLSTGKSSVDRASYYMLHLHRSNLEVRLRMIDESALQTDPQKKAYETVAEMLRTPCEKRLSMRGVEWDALYKMERLICLLLSGAELRHEIRVRLQELTAAGAPGADTLRSDYEQMLKPAGEAPAPQDAMLRAVLLRVMEAIQWHAKKKYLAGPIRKEATKNILYCVLIAFLLVIAPYLLLNFWGSEQIGKWWSLFALYTALASGLLGAFFSRLITVQRSWSTMTLDEVFLHREWSYTLLRAGVGMCGALIVYFFLRSEFMSGALFPEFTEVALHYVRIDRPDAVPMSFVMPSKHLALLTFWCFLAGFSEALVPSILANTERQMAQAGAAPSSPTK